jgi:hypothetical protein
MVLAVDELHAAGAHVVTKVTARRRPVRRPVTPLLKKVRYRIDLAPVARFMMPARVRCPRVRAALAT